MSVNLGVSRRMGCVGFSGHIERGMSAEYRNVECGMSGGIFVWGPEVLGLMGYVLSSPETLLDCEKRQLLI